MRLLLASPFLPPFYDGLLTERKTVLELLKTSGDLSWCEDFVAVRLNGITIPRPWWPHVTVKPEAAGTLHLCVVPQKGNILPIVASVALVALTAGIGAFGVPFLGAGFAAGSFGASAVAAGVGIAGQLAIRALTAPPAAGKGGRAAERDLSQAGIGQNQITLFETLPTVHGKMLVSPPVISPPYTTLNNDELTVHAIVGMQGRCRIENILINGIDIALQESISYETREGGPADAALTLAQLICIQQNEQVALSTFRTRQGYGNQGVLDDQTTPDNSLPVFHPFTTDGTADEIWIRMMMPSGLLSIATGGPGAVPLRIEIRKVGDVSWRKLPTIHVHDVKLGNGPLRVEVKLKFQTPASGRHFSHSADQFPIFELTNVTGIGTAFEYQSDAYFQDATTDIIGSIPDMTSGTTSGVTMSASSTNGTDAAWKAGDRDDSTYWRPANNSLPADLITDFGSAVTIRSYSIVSDYVTADVNPTHAPLKWSIYGSNNAVDYTALDDAEIDISALPLTFGHFQIGNPGSYRYYKITFTTNNGAANEELHVASIQMFTRDAIGTFTTQSDSGLYGYFARHNSGSLTRCKYGSLDQNGATFYLDPAQWIPGQYEVLVQRGFAFDSDGFSASAYSYNSSATATRWFGYTLSGGSYVIGLNQKDFRSDINVEVFSTVSYDVPVDTTGIACIAVELKNTVIDSISAEMTSYASEFDGTVWAETEVPTQNPAALYRKLLLGHAHPNPSPAEIINEDELAAWFTRCDSAGHECNFLQQGRSIAEVKQVIAATGYASPRESNMLSVVEDYDRSGESISQMISPLNSKLLGATIPLPELEHALYVEYLDEDDDWKIRRDIVYRDGFNADTATLFATVTYDGWTDATKVAARAAFDLQQVISRARTISVEMGIEGYSLQRGSLVGHNDDVLDLKQAQGLITSIQTSGGNIVSITVDNVIPFSLSQGDVESIDDITDLTDILDTDAAMGVAIRLEDGTSIVKTLTDVTDSNICTFATPFTEAGSGVAVGQMCVFGIAGREYARMLVMAVEPQGLETRIVTLAAEAPELFA